MLLAWKFASTEEANLDPNQVIRREIKAYITILEALRKATGPVLCRMLLQDEQPRSDGWVASKSLLLWSFNATDLLLKFEHKWTRMPSPGYVPGPLWREAALGVRGIDDVNVEQERWWIDEVLLAKAAR